MDQEEQLQEAYKPRPRWQVWAARIGLAVFVVFLIVFYLGLFGGK